MRKQSVVMALIGMIDLIMSGRHYETQNPYTRPEVKTAFKALDCEDMTYNQLERKFNRGGLDDFMKEDDPRPSEVKTPGILEGDDMTPSEQAMALRKAGNRYETIAATMGISIGKAHYLCNPEKNVKS